MKTPQEHYYDLERIVELDFVRATEAAALNSIQWLGRGATEKADASACDAIRGMFDLMHIRGQVVIGKGIEDSATDIFKGEHLGTWLPGTIRFDLALDPIDGTTNIANGAPNAISCIAAASPEEGVVSAMKDIPSAYMMKLAYGPKVIRHMQVAGVQSVNIRNPIEENLISIARALGKRVQDLVVQVLDRPRHDRLIEEIRSAGAAIRMITDGDIAAAIAPSLPDSEIDVFVGIGGSTEAVLAAAGIKSLGGDMQCRIWPKDANERLSIVNGTGENDLEKVYHADDLAHGRNIIFCATGISESPLLPGVVVKGHSAITHSVLMRARSRTVRFIRTFHELETKTIRLRSDRREHRI